MSNVLSPFVITADNGKGILLFNTINNSIVEMSYSEYDNGNLKTLRDQDKIWLHSNQYFEKREDTIERMNKLRLNDRRLLDITISFTQNCNFGCTYCSQLDNKDTDKITEEAMDSLITYIKNCIDTEHYEKIGINLFGGEPLLYKDSIYYLKENLERVIPTEMISYGLGTNGSLLDEDFLLKFDQIGICVPLTNKLDHDKNRPFISGSGSYDCIVDNLLKCNHLFNDKRRLGIRFNVGDNYSQFGTFLQELRRLKLNIQYIDVAYTCEFSYTKYKNALSKEQYSKWYTKQAIHEIINAGFKVRFPRSSFFTCKAYSKHSIKMYSDGKLGTCNGYHYKMRRGSITDVCDNVSFTIDLLGDVKKSTIVDEQCNHCKYLLLCGGKYFCRKDDYCQFCEYSVEDFLITYYDYHSQGMGNYFE